MSGAFGAAKAQTGANRRVVGLGQGGDRWSRGEPLQTKEMVVVTSEKMPAGRSVPLADGNEIPSLGLGVCGRSQMAARV